MAHSPRNTAPLRTSTSSVMAAVTGSSGLANALERNVAALGHETLGQRDDVRDYHSPLSRSCVQLGSVSMDSQVRGNRLLECSLLFHGFLLLTAAADNSERVGRPTVSTSSRFETRTLHSHNRPLTDRRHRPPVQLRSVFREMDEPSHQPRTQPAPTATSSFVSQAKAPLQSPSPARSSSGSVLHVCMSWKLLS